MLSVGLATGLVAALQGVAAPEALGAVYLLAVMEVAVRRGELAALVTAVLSVLTLNYLFVSPRHQFAIAHRQDVVELAVLLIAAVVVGRLAAISRRRAAEAEARAHLATVREREASLLAETASGILAGQSVLAQLERVGRRVAEASGASRARLVLEAVPAGGPDEIVLALGSRSRPGWLYVSPDSAWSREDLERLAEPLGRLIDVGVERERLSEREAEREAARRADLARTAVLQSVSHDLRSPLTAITTALSALRSAAVSEREQAELLTGMQADAARLARLVDDLLDLSRIEAGAVAPQADWCDVRDIVASARAGLDRRHEIEFDLPSELPLIRADAAQLERVFSNLMHNAVKFSAPEVPVRVSGGASAGRVTVRVTNYGRVIPRQERTRVFEPFFRGNAGGGAGSGLGLAICRGFVEANGGRISIQSERERGTSFAVSFPLAAQPREDSAPVSPVGSPRRGRG